MTCAVPSCARPVGADPHADETGGLCDACRAAEERAHLRCDDEWLRRLDDLDGGSRWFEVLDPPRKLYQPLAEVKVPRWDDPDGSAYGLAALRGLIGELSAFTEPGSGRNVALNRAAYRAGQLAAGGELREQVARASLRWCAEQMGLPRWEYTTVIERALRDGAKRPACAPERRAA